jgi:translation initiation factor 5B
MYGWEAVPDNGVQDSLARQKDSTKREFEERAKQTMIAFAEQGLNAELYYRNTDPRRVVSLVRHAPV